MCFKMSQSKFDDNEVEFEDNDENENENIEKLELEKKFEMDDLMFQEENYAVEKNGTFVDDLSEIHEESSENDKKNEKND
jgi:hypothetical protein